MTTKKHWSNKLPASACADAKAWAREQPSYRAAWTYCERGDWMLWLAGRLSSKPESASRRKLVLCACACARTALRFVPNGETRPRVTIETAERWARGEHGVTLEAVRAAADASVCHPMSATYAAYAAAYAAGAARYAADAADAADAARPKTFKKTFKRCADIVRTHYPTPPRLVTVNVGPSIWAE